MWWRGVVQVALAAVVVASVGGCSTQPGDADCLPAPLIVSPSTDLVPLEHVTVSSKGFTCEPSDRHGLETLAFGLRGTPLARVPVHPDGSFTATFQVPGGMRLGPSEIDAFGPTTYLCQPGEDCATYGVGVTIRR